MHRFLQALLSTVAMAAAFPAAATCQFSWYHHGDIDFDMGKLLAENLPDSWCERFTDRDAEIVVLTSRYYGTDQGALGHAMVGVHKPGSKRIPARSFTAYRRNAERNTVGAADELVAEAVRYALRDMMSVVQSLKVE